MKKIILCIVTLLVILTGCTNSMSDTPTKKVENFMNKYQSLDSEILTQLDNIVANDNSMNEDQRKDYIALMKKQYQNLSYKIKDEVVEDDTANVTTEIEVYDYRSALDKSEEYYNDNKDEFTDSSDNIDDSKYMDYKIKEMQKVADRKKYEIVFTLTKDKDGKWVLDNITDNDREKIHGLYEE